MQSDKRRRACSAPHPRAGAKIWRSTNSSTALIFSSSGSPSIMIAWPNRLREGEQIFFHRVADAVICEHMAILHA